MLIPEACDTMPLGSTRSYSAKGAAIVPSMKATASWRRPLRLCSSLRRRRTRACTPATSCHGGSLPVSLR